MEYDREQLNRAFWDLGLRFQWDEETWAVLSAMPDLRTRLSYYLEHHQPHLLGVYDADFLGRLIEERLASPAEARMGMEAPRSL